MAFREYKTHEIGPSPVVIELPGLVLPEENTRTGKVLESLSSSYGISGIRVNYTGIKRIGNNIVCDFCLNDAINDFENVLKHIANNPKKYDSNKVGVVASSMGAMVFAEYITNLKPKDFQIRSHASISPLASWKNYANEKYRTDIVNNRKNLVISLPLEKILRYVPNCQLDWFSQIDGLEKLKQAHEKKHISEMDVLTLIGASDQISNPKAMKEYHTYLGGGLKDIEIYNSGHDISPFICIPRLVRFFVEKSATGNSRELRLSA